MNLKWISAKDLIETEIKKPNWLIENIVAEGGIVMIGGEPASFKSYFALYGAVCGASNIDVLDKFKTKKI